MGKGRFICETATKNPDTNFIGIEKSATIVLKACENYKIFNEPQNLKFLCTNVENLERNETYELFFNDLINSDSSTEHTNTGDQVVAIAHSALGCPYVLGAAGPNEFDASGLVCYCYGCKGHVWSTYTFVNQQAGWKEIRESEAVRGDVVSSTGSAEK